MLCYVVTLRYITLCYVMLYFSLPGICSSVLVGLVGFSTTTIAKGWGQGTCSASTARTPAVMVLMAMV